MILVNSHHKCDSTVMNTYTHKYTFIEWLTVPHVSGSAHLCPVAGRPTCADPLGQSPPGPHQPRTPHLLLSHAWWTPTKQKPSIYKSLMTIGVFEKVTIKNNFIIVYNQTITRMVCFSGKKPNCILPKIFVWGTKVGVESRSHISWSSF